MTAAVLPFPTVKNPVEPLPEVRAVDEFFMLQDVYLSVLVRISAGDVKAARDAIEKIAAAPSSCTEPILRRAVERLRDELCARLRTRIAEKELRG